MERRGVARRATIVIVLALAVGACSVEGSTDAGTDSGRDLGGVEDLGAVADAGMDAGLVLDAAVDAGRPTWLCRPGAECPGFHDAVATVPREVDDPISCYGILHQRDCCGARLATGVNFFAQLAACEPEAACEAIYDHVNHGCATDADCPGGQTCSCAHSSCSCGPTVPLPCSDDRILTDSGETTTNLAEVRVGCVRAGSCPFGTGTCCTCYTHLCHDDGGCPGEPTVHDDPCGFTASGP